MSHIRYICVGFGKSIFSHTQYGILLLERLITPTRKAAANLLECVDGDWYSAAFISFMKFAFHKSQDSRLLRKFLDDPTLVLARPKFPGHLSCSTRPPGPRSKTRIPRNFPCWWRDAHGMNHKVCFKMFLHVIPTILGSNRVSRYHDVCDTFRSWETLSYAPPRLQS